MSDLSTLQEILAKSFSRYLTVLPSGLQLPHNKIVPSLEVKILKFSPARTLYQDKKPVCRSLDGIRSLKEHITCASCPLRKTCTPQVYLNLLSDGIPLTLLLAYTSARNFLLFAGKLQSQGLPIEKTAVLLTVRDRGRWGEVNFELKSSAQT